MFKDTPPPKRRGSGRGCPLPRQRFQLPRQLLRIRRNKTMILLLSHQVDATRSPVQRMPDFQKHALAILAPLVIPESQHLDTLFGEKFFPRLVALNAFRRAMLKTIQFHRQSRHWAIAIQKKAAHRMLSAELESGETTRLHRVPEFLLLDGLIPAKLTGTGGTVHAKRINSPECKPSASSPRPSPPFGMEERERRPLRVSCKTFFFTRAAEHTLEMDLEPGITAGCAPKIKRLLRIVLSSNAIGGEGGRRPGEEAQPQTMMLKASC